MKRILSTSWTFTLLTGCLALIGCNGAGPDFTSRPNYTPATDLPRFNAETTVSVRVVDARQKKLGSREDGREVIAEGDKGKVFLSEAPGKTLERNLTDALTKAGFKVEPNAPVVVDANLSELMVNAQEFTHWGLPSERASSLDAFGALLPGPVRPTIAKTVVNVVIRKNDQRMGFAYNVTKEAENKDRDRAVVETTIGQSMTAVIDQIVRDAAGDINLAAKLPVSAAEIAAQANAYNQQLAQLNVMKQLIAEERSQLTADRADLAAVKAELERDRSNWAAERARIQAKNVDAAKLASALSAEEAKVKQLQAVLAAKDAEMKKLADSATGRTAEQTAQLKKAQGDLAAAQAEIKKLTDAAAAAAAAGAADSAAQAARLKQLQADLAAKQAEVDRLALTGNRTAEEAARLKSLQDEARKQADELAKSRQALVDEQQRVADLKAQVARQQADLERRERDFSKMQENLNNRIKELEAKESATNNLNANLGKQQNDLAKKEEGLQKWEKQLQAKSEEKPPVALVQNLRPSVAVVEPQPNVSETSTPRAVVRGILMDDRAIMKKRFTVNGREVSGKQEVQFTSGAKGFRIERVAAVPAGVKGTGTAGTGAQVFEKYEFVAELVKGNNVITIEAWDDEGLGAKEELVVNYKPGEGKVYIVAVGINKYQSIPQLKYAAADAKVVAKVLQDRLSVPDENVTLLLDEQATLQNIKRTLGSDLKSRVTKQDMAIIFFSGHGAPEEDAASADQDGIEKYLLPVDADINSFFATAMPMKDITEIFRRLGCERVVFIADTCYSGAVGNADGKTVAKPGKTFRAFAIERAVNRLGGTGRIIMTASKGSEVSQEKDDLGHGVFSYYVAQGLSGKADANRDRLVTATELHNYVAVEVPKATANNQNPLMSKDEAVGEIVLSVVK